VRGASPGNTPCPAACSHLTFDHFVLSCIDNGAVFEIVLMQQTTAGSVQSEERVLRRGGWGLGVTIYAFDIMNDKSLGVGEEVWMCV
jgi:hypothetical protein